MSEICLALLLVLVLLAPLTAVLLGVLPELRLARRVARAAGSAMLGLALVALACLPDEGVSWGLGGVLLLRLDLLSTLLIGLVSFLAWLVLLTAPASWASRRALGRALWSASLLTCLFLAADFRVFVLFWIASLVPGYLGLRAQAGGRPLARVYAYYLGASAILVLVAGSAAAVGGTTTWKLAEFTRGASSSLRALVAVCLLAAVALRQGLFPFHSWFPAAFRKQPLGPAMLYFGPAVGVYALDRLREPMLGGPGSTGTQVLVIGALVSAVYTAGLALVQRSFRPALGYLVLSQSALIFTGLEAVSAEGRVGALVVLLSVGSALTGLALAGWALEARSGEIDLTRFGGYGHAAPQLATAFLLLGLAAVGIPGTLAFVGEDLLTHGVLESFPTLGVLFVSATALNAISVMRLFLRIFCGARCMPVHDLLPRETVGLLAVVVLAWVGGLLPGPLVAWLTSP